MWLGITLPKTPPCSGNAPPTPRANSPPCLTPGPPPAATILPFTFLKMTQTQLHTFPGQAALVLQSWDLSVLGWPRFAQVPELCWGGTRRKRNNEQTERGIKNRQKEEQWMHKKRKGWIIKSCVSKWRTKSTHVPLLWKKQHTQPFVSIPKYNKSPWLFQKCQSVWSPKPQTKLVLLHLPALQICAAALYLP